MSFFTKLYKFSFFIDLLFLFLNFNRNLFDEDLVLEFIGKFLRFLLILLFLIKYRYILYNICILFVKFLIIFY